MSLFMTIDTLLFYFDFLLRQLNCLSKQVQIIFILFSFFSITLYILDVVSLEKVADLDKNIGEEKLTIDGFQEVIDLLESLTLKSGAS